MRKEYKQLVTELKRARKRPYSEGGEVSRISMQLAAIPDESAHEELYKMASPLRMFIKNRLKTATQWDAGCQLIACEALAETGTQKALHFLTSLAESSKPEPYRATDWYESVKYGIREQEECEIYSRLEKCVERARQTYEQKRVTNR